MFHLKTKIKFLLLLPCLLIMLAAQDLLGAEKPGGTEGEEGAGRGKRTTSVRGSRGGRGGRGRGTAVRGRGRGRGGASAPTTPPDVVDVSGDGEEEGEEDMDTGGGAGGGDAAMAAGEEETGKGGGEGEKEKAPALPEKRTKMTASEREEEAKGKGGEEKGKQPPPRKRARKGHSPASESSDEDSSGEESVDGSSDDSSDEDSSGEEESSKKHEHGPSRTKIRARLKKVTTLQQMSFHSMSQLSTEREQDGVLKLYAYMCYNTFGRATLAAHERFDFLAIDAICKYQIAHHFDKLRASMTLMHLAAIAADQNIAAYVYATKGQELNMLADHSRCTPFHYIFRECTPAHLELATFLLTPYKEHDDSKTDATHKKYLREVRALLVSRHVIDRAKNCPVQCALKSRNMGPFIAWVASNFNEEIGQSSRYQQMLGKLGIAEGEKVSDDEEEPSHGPKRTRSLHHRHHRPAAPVRRRHLLNLFGLFGGSPAPAPESKEEKKKK